MKTKEYVEGWLLQIFEGVEVTLERESIDLKDEDRVKKELYDDMFGTIYDGDVILPDEICKQIEQECTLENFHNYLKANI